MKDFLIKHMKRNKLILLATSFFLVTGIVVMSQFSGAGSVVNNQIQMFSEEEEEDEHAQEIRGAMESIYSMRLNEATGTLEPEWVEQAIAQADKLRVSSRAAKPITWENMGPDNVGGRSRAFLMHRDSANLMFVGCVSGGLFRSNTTGQSWYPVNDMESNLNVNCIAQTPDGTIYYGTGEGGFTNLDGTRNGSPAFLGRGVYKSTDNRGLDFNNLSNTAAWYACNAMVAHPTENWLWVATESGLYRTANGGTNFTLVRSGTYKDMAIDKDGIVWASTSNGTILKGNSDGTTMTTMNNGIAPLGRTSIAISPQDPQYVYVMGSNSSGLTGIWRTTNGGTDWEKIVAYSTITNILGGQGYYDNVIGVDPLNKNKIFMGGVVLATWDIDKGFREIASTFDAPWSNSYVHADKHIIQFNMRTSPPTMIVGTDGGLYFSQNQSTWTPRNRGYTSLQCYNIAANYLGHMVGGSQDNGNYLINFTGNSFDGKPSKTGIHIGPQADGFDTEFSRFKPEIIFVSMQNGPVYRTANSGQSTSTFWDDRQDGSVPTDFNTTFTLWEKSATESKLFLAKNSDVWVAINPTDFSNPVDWFLVAQSLGNDRIIEMDHTPDGDHLFICKSQRVYRVDSILSATWDPSSAVRAIPAPIKTVNITPAAAAGRVVTSVNVDQSNPNHVVVTLGGYGNSAYVYESNNALAVTPTWSNITGNLPSMPVYDAVIDTDDPDRIILATDLGIWLTENGGTNWEEANTGMARLPVFEIRGYEFNPWEGMVMYIGTHGRGYFKSGSLLTSTKKLEKDATSIKVYPNPARENIQIAFTAKANGKAVVEIYSIKGELVKTVNHNSVAGNNTVALDVSAYKAGYYFARVIQGSSASTSKFAVSK
jgi:hypothetical protein